MLVYNTKTCLIIIKSVCDVKTLFCDIKTYVEIVSKGTTYMRLQYVTREVSLNAYRVIPHYAMLTSSSTAQLPMSIRLSPCHTSTCNTCSRRCCRNRRPSPGSRKAGSTSYFTCEDEWLPSEYVTLRRSRRKR